MFPGEFSPRTVWRATRFASSQTLRRNIIQHLDAMEGGPASTSVVGTTDTSRFQLCSHIIKRFETNAVSASSLFRAAFPTATEDEEAVEMRWIVVGSRGQYGDTAAAGMEHVESKKLSGTWCVGDERTCHCFAPRFGGDQADLKPAGSRPSTHTRSLPNTVLFATQGT